MLNISKKLIGYSDLLEKLDLHFTNNSLPNSIIFHGLEGIGKTTFSYFLINKIYMSLTNPNLHSHHNNLIYNNSHPNLRILKKEVDLKTKKLRNYIIIDQIRNLENFIYQSGTDNLPKFIIIDSADDLNVNSANALLKILEEPKKNTYFILISNQLSLLIPTIRSRCIKFAFSNPSIDQFREIMHNNIKLDDSDLNILFDISCKSPGLAIKLYESDIYQKFNNLLFIIKDKKLLSSQIIDLSDTVSSYNNSEYKNFLFLFKFIILNMIKFNSGFNIDNLFISEISNTIKDLSINFNNLTLLNVLEYLKNNENDLFIFNIDKKNFNLNLFSLLVSS